MGVNVPFATNSTNDGSLNPTLSTVNLLPVVGVHESVVSVPSDTTSSVYVWPDVIADVTIVLIVVVPYLTNRVLVVAEVVPIIYVAVYVAALIPVSA